jgi:hypothetical protein
MILALLGQGGVSALSILAPHPAPIANTAPPVVQATPVPSVPTTTAPPTVRPTALAPSPVVYQARPAAPTPTTVPPVPVATTTTTPPAGVTSTGLECVVTITSPQGYTMTYSPGPADSSGNCALGIPEPYSVTSNQ